MLDEQDIPQDGDYVLGDVGTLGSHTSVSVVGDRHLEDFADCADAKTYIKERMESEQFWPNVWICSDHGNLHLTTLED